MRRVVNRSLAICLAAAMAFIPFFGNMVLPKDIKAATVKGSLATEVTGTWSYWDGSATVTQTNKMLLDKLPTVANKGSSRYTTDRFDENYGAFPTNGWSTSMAWNYTSNAFGNATYAIPLSFIGKADGLYVTKPSTVKVDGTFIMQQPENGALTDFIIGTDYQFSSTKMDKITDWSTDIIMENSADSSRYMKTTMVQGSPFSFYSLKGGTTAQIRRGSMRATLPSKVTYHNAQTQADSTTFVLRVVDNQDESLSYSKYDYYALYVANGTNVSVSGSNTDIGTITMNFKDEEHAYFTFAWLCETTDADDAKAQAIAQTYEKYAYNFITDTRAEYNYDTSTATVTTNFKYEFDKKDESTTDETIMGILPHQYKFMEGYTYLANTARTIRGTMKYLVGNTYTTVQKYSGILPQMGSVADEDKDKLQTYIDNYMTEFGPTQTAVTKESYDVNTYDTGKKLNRAVQVMLAAETIGDTENATALLNGIKAELADWFTASGDGDLKYFYYDKGTGCLFGFPQSYYSVDGMQDHTFHYGYFINAAAQVIMRDKAFETEYGNILHEIIEDIACDTRNNLDSKYPYLRSFSAWEGHSWASGHANFGDGNNQESSSEALNAWAGLILYGQATGDDSLTERAVYLYTTEANAVNDYWFDIDGDILDSNYTVTTAQLEYDCASMIWGGKYTYAAWWTDEPLQIQGINLLPVTGASFNLSKDKEYVKHYFELAQQNENRHSGPHKLPTPTDRWNEIWSEYLAMADPYAAEDYFDDTCDPEAGESKAHAYHFIKALQKSGTPNTDISSNCPLSKVFETEDGERTYIAYNSGDEAKEVKFSDGTVITVQAKTLGEVSSEDIPDRISYNTEYYLENVEGNGYSKIDTVKAYGKLNDEVFAEVKTITGASFDTDNPLNIATTTLSNSNTTLKLYYSRNTYSIKYNLGGGSLPEANPDSYKYGQAVVLNNPEKDKNRFDGWFLDEGFTTEFDQTATDYVGDIELYAKFTDPSTMTIDGDKRVNIYGTKAVFTVEGYSKASEMIVYTYVEPNYATGQNIIKTGAVGLFAGNQMTKNGDQWTYSMDLEGKVGKYLIFFFNSMVEGEGEQSSWAMMQIPNPDGTPSEPESSTENGTTKPGETTKPSDTTGPSGSDTSEYSKYTYAKIGTVNGKDISYYIVKNDLQANVQFLNGNLLYMAHSADFNDSNITATLNGDASKMSVGQNVIQATSDKLKEDAYNVILLNYTDGKYTEVIVKVGNPVDETTKVQATTNEPDTTKAPETTKNPTTTKEPDTTKTPDVTQPETSKDTPTQTPTTTSGDGSATTEAPTQAQTTKSSETTSDNKKTTTAAEMTAATKVQQSVTVKRVKIKKVTRKKKSVKVTISKVSKAKGYQVRISTSKKFAKKKTKYKTVKKTKFVLKNLKVGKKYYIGVRAYKTVNGKRKYGKWSKTRVTKRK